MHRRHPGRMPEYPPMPRRVVRGALMPPQRPRPPHLPPHLVPPQRYPQPRPMHMPRPPIPRHERSKAKRVIGGAAGALILLSGFGLHRASDREECQQIEAGIISDIACGYGFSQDNGGYSFVATPSAAAEAPRVQVPAAEAPAQQAETPAASRTVAEMAGFPAIQAPSGFETGWYTDPGTNLTTMVIGGNLAFYQFDPQTKENYPVGERGGRCGENTYASGIAYLTGQVVSPITLWQQIESNGGHSPTGSGLASHRGLVASMYGLQNHYFDSIQEAERFARSAEGNFYLIIGQDKTSGDSFSIHGSHIIGLIWSERAQAWQSFDPNDYYMQDAEPDLDDNLRFHTTASLDGLYDIQGWTNPNGLPSSYSWRG